MLYNYNQLIEKISRASGLSVEEIDRRVAAKCAKLSGLISKEGSAQIIASELGISLEKEKLKINELVSGMKKANLIAKIVEVSSVREYSKNNRQGKVVSLTLGDDTGTIRAVLWDTNHIKLIEDGIIKKDDVVEISNASVRNDELHLSGFSDIKKSKEIIEEVNLSKNINEKPLNELKVGESAIIRAFITQVFEPKFFEVCPECKKRTIESLCDVHGDVISEKKALLSLVLDDGTENMRAILFNDKLNLIGLNDSDLEDKDNFFKKKMEIIGKEFLFSVTMRENRVLSINELIVNDVMKIDLDKVIERLRDSIVY